MNRTRSHEADDGTTTTYPYENPSHASSVLSSIASFRDEFVSGKTWKGSRFRHTLGIVLLLVTVVLWTTCNFLASTIFADNTFSKPYFVTYVNTSFFCFPLIPLAIRTLYKDPSEIKKLKLFLPSRFRGYSKLQTDDIIDDEDTLVRPDERPGHGIVRPDSLSGSMGLEDDPLGSQILGLAVEDSEKLGLVETAKLSLEFCFLWFAANYFISACLEYTTVASATILTSTSSMWTLLIGSLWGVERFTIKKLGGVMVSLAGIALISSVDMSGETNKNRGTFPHKTTKEIAVGDAMAFFSAGIYGLYAVVMKKRIGDESRVNMPLFFGIVGLCNVVLLWPGFLILHFSGIETFELPPTGKVLTIILVNSTSSVISDYAWAYSMLLTSPLITTVGLSLTIPLSLIGQMVLDGQYSSITYWFGAAMIVASFLFVNHEEVKDEEMMASGMLPGMGGSHLLGET